MWMPRAFYHERFHKATTRLLEQIQSMRDHSYLNNRSLFLSSFIGASSHAGPMYIHIPYNETVAVKDFKTKLVNS